MAWEKLTRRDRECAILLIGGEKTRGVAKILGISPRTVEVHRARLLVKFNVRTVKQLRALDGRPAGFEALHKALIEKHDQYEASILATTRRLNPLVDEMLFLASNVLTTLVGATVPEVVCDHGFAGPLRFPCAGLRLKLENGERKVAWILRNPEGNGMGWVELEDEHQGFSSPS